MAGKQLKKQFNNVSLGKKDVEFSYFKVAFAARASVDAEIEVNGADAVDPEKAVRDAAGDWFAHKGKDALGFGGNPFGGLNWTKSDGDPKSLKIVLQGQSAVSGAKLHVEFQLVDLTKVQGIKAEVHGKFLTYPHEKAVRSEERRVGKECRSRWSPHH